MARWEIEAERIIDADGTIRRELLDFGEVLPVQPGSALVAADTFKQSHGLLKQAKIVLDGNVLTIVDSGANGGHGSLTLFTCPLGLIYFFGAHASLTITEDSDDIDADSAVVASIGSAAPGVDNDTLTGTEADIVASTAMTLVTSTDTETLISTDTEMPALLDGTATAVAPKLNFAIPAADIAADGDLILDGTIWLTFLSLGPH